MTPALADPRGARATSVLCVNGGSSSVKVARFQVGGTEVGGDVEEQARLERDVEGGDHRAALTAALDEVVAGAGPPDVVGHRVVHGGARFTEPVVVDDVVLDELHALASLAPLHQPVAIELIEHTRARFPDVAQVACFDTAFHRTMPASARRLPIPARFDAAGVRRYGFHGLSYEYVVGSLGAAALGRAVVAHLGSGASMAAIRDGASVDTTMGFTPAGGLVMSSRSGDLDPGVLVHILRTEEHDADDLERIVERESGLAGVSGRTGDMRELLECRGDDADAALAVDMFCTRVRMQVGAYAARLGGIDNLVFTGGIGERSAAVRAEICVGLEHLGAEVDEQRNRADAAIVSPDGASCVVRVVPTDEELVIARHAARLVGAPR